MKKQMAIFGFLLTAGLSAPLGADIVYLTTGGEIEGRVVDQGDSLRVEFPTGSMTVDKTAVARIEARQTPQQEFASRFRKNPQDPDASVELALWALQKGLKKEYLRALRQALHLDPDHAEAQRRLQNYHLRMEYLPFNEQAAQRLQQEFGAGFQIRRTHHFRIAYNSSDLYAELSGDLLEEVYLHFIRFFEDRHFRPVPLTDRLEVILFHAREDFLKHALTLGNDMSGAAGYYLTETNRSYFYDAVNDGKYESHVNDLQEAQSRLDKSRQQVTANRQGSVRYRLTAPDGSEQTLDREEMLAYLDSQQKVLDGQFTELRSTYRGRNITNTVHEAVHQLAYNCGIHSRYCENPKWLVEGLALYFESSDPRHWEGPGTVLPHRLTPFLAASGTVRHITLRQLLTSDEVFDTTQSRAAEAYASAWALFYYLAERDHENFFDYIHDLSNRLANEPYSPQERLEDFETYIADIPRVERQWHDYMKLQRR